jgi:hypothetical protein
MANIKIAVINATSSDEVLTDVDAQAAVLALQKQVTNDFAPVWGINADLSFVPRNGEPAVGAWWLVLLDTSDQATALGYHDLTVDGLPLGKAFVLTDKQAGLQWTVTASHELLEMLGDPDINLWAFPHPEAHTDRLYAYEMCDACEADALGYLIDGTLVSDFLYPAWFESFRLPGSTQFDRQSHIQEPFQIPPGGYSLVYDIRTGTGYQQIYGDKEEVAFTPLHRPQVGSRRERRKTPRMHWWRSLAHKSCGVERWPVKTLGDADAGKVVLTTLRPATVTEMRQLARPFANNLLGPQDSRSDPVELTVYTMTVALVGAKIESDSDVHLVVADPNDHTATMIVEFPDPHCIESQDAALVARMTNARSAVLNAVPTLVQKIAAGGAIPAAAFNPQTQKMKLQPMSGLAQIIGVGFFDTIHGQDGVAPNGVELHPVLDFSLLPTPGQ